MSTKFESELNVYLKLFDLLYADGTTLLSVTPEDLQHNQPPGKTWQVPIRN